MDITELASVAALGDLERRIYEHAVSHVCIREEDLPAYVQAEPEQISGAVQVLLTLGLLREQEGSPGTHVAVAPDSAELQLVGPALRYVMETQQAMDRLRGEFSGLLDTYRSGVVHRLRREGVEVIINIADVRARLEEFSAGATREVLTALPGGTRPTEAMGGAGGRMEAVLARGVTVRALCQHTAQFSSSTLALVEHVTARGAQVRTLGDTFSRLIVIDRETALIELHDDSRGAVLVRDPSVVAFLIKCFERMWVQGRPFPLSVGRREAIAASEAVKEDIVRMLIAGEDDKAIARRMGVSVRTCQRHITEIMMRVGARNRVQAGYLLREGEPHGRPEEEKRDRPRAVARETGPSQPQWHSSVVH